MADYKTIKGYKVQSRASDPTVDEGQIWYNTTSAALKYDAIGAGAWSAGGDMNNGREGGGTGFGSATAGVAMGGSPGPGALVEEYNGTGWTEVESLPTPGGQGGTFGSQTAGIGCLLYTSDAADDLGLDRSLGREGFHDRLRLELDHRLGQHRVENPTGSGPRR